jgi:hypothetical protein
VFLVAIAAIIAGIAVLSQGATIAAEYGRLLTTQGDVAPISGGGTWSLELLSGAAGIVLGILALPNVYPVELVAISAIAFGGGLILSSGPAAQLLALRVSGAFTDERSRRLSAEAGSNAALSQGMVGLAVVVLGILALAGFASLALILIALLTLGIFLLVSGTIFGGLVLSIFHR